MTKSLFLCMSVMTAILVAAPAFAMTCDGSGYTYSGDKTAGVLSGGALASAQEMGPQPGAEEEWAFPAPIEALESQDGLTYIVFKDDGTAVTSVHTNPNDDSTIRDYTLTCR
jgi:hypothetical protein